MGKKNRSEKALWLQDWRVFILSKWTYNWQILHSARLAEKYSKRILCDSLSWVSLKNVFLLRNSQLTVRPKVDSKELWLCCYLTALLILFIFFMYFILKNYNFILYSKNNILKFICNNLNSLKKYLKLLYLISMSSLNIS